MQYKIFYTEESLEQCLSELGIIIDNVYKNYYWNTLDNKIFYINGLKHCNSTKSDIIWANNLYIFIDEKEIHILENEKNESYSIVIEDKLYHLTHGSKSLSIPDAFRVLSL